MKLPMSGMGVAAGKTSLQVFLEFFRLNAAPLLA
ncbi:hypothetical protein AVDCRST_MAG94-5242 [uncultured Leptolyngbya sp.]|uniref:Uncharacterized protein n=1 Tax=uncultured Leptolyngbya sp. TaxID=332963 RepID=A0A6J4NP54_9CYAN|nr:hypothetical protein AVDCRST_MAG94-5242 [uncultured Leptolyngbya sp.]